MTLLASLARTMRPLVDRHHPRAAMAYRHFRELRHVDRQPVATPFGFWFTGHPQMELGEFEVAETALVRRELAGVDALVNVGANIGWYSCLALQAGKRVLAFEPVPENLRVLYRNVTLNGWAERIEVAPVALGGQPGLADLYGGGTAASLVAGWAGIPEAYRQTVPVSTLDLQLAGRFVGERLFLVVDIEGAELAMLDGAAATLRREPKPLWMVEISIDEHQPQGARLNPNLAETFDRFERAGYGAWQIGATVERLPYARIRRIASSGVNNLDTHNFLFAPPDHAPVAG